MDGFDRIYDLHRILKNRKTPLSTQDICRQMECSRATFNRVKRHMVDFLGAPIEYDRNFKGYRYAYEDSEHFELPGLWFNQQELHALLLVRELIHSLGVGVLKNDIIPIEKRLDSILANSGLNAPNFTQHFRLLGMHMRNVEPNIFSQITDAIVKSQSLLMHYEKLDSQEPSEREISPQRLINYRNNWYLDAWCHKQQHYRTFALEGIRTITPSSSPYHVIDSITLDNYFQASYGIYAGSNIEQACIRFSPAVAKRVSREAWHPEQEGEFNDDGSYELTLPFNADHPDELLMDVVKYFGNAKVIAPSWLQEHLQKLLKTTTDVYV
ncbi:hypothetical protein TDB9533_00192 [Thalassocella blandensis]|nr:hypothetical protein TDB9533_00192 [Thalassocella blandensis]